MVKPYKKNVTSKASRTLGFVRRNLRIGVPKIKEKAYFTLIRPQLEYASSVWDPHHHTDIYELERIQRRAARYVTGNWHNRSSVSDMIEDLGWDSLAERRRKSRLTLMYKIQNNLVAVNGSEFFSPLRSKHTRSYHPQKIAVFAPNTDIFKYSFFPRTVLDWNGLPLEAIEADELEGFKAWL